MLLAQSLGELHLWLFEFFALLRQVEVVRCQGEDDWFEGHEPSGVLFLVVGQDCAVFFIDECVVTFLGLAGLYSGLYPLLEFQVLAVGTFIVPCRDVLLSLPKIHRA